MKPVIWFTVSTEDKSFNRTCNNIAAVNRAIKEAERLKIEIYKLTVCEYEYDKICGNNESLVDFCNAEVFNL